MNFSTNFKTNVTTMIMKVSARDEIVEVTDTGPAGREQSTANMLCS